MPAAADGSRGAPSCTENEGGTASVYEAVLEYLPIVMRGPAAWDTEPTIRRAIEIHDGQIKNPRILSFQGRSPTYPYDPSEAAAG